MRRFLSLFCCAGLALSGLVNAMGMGDCCCDVTFEVGAELLIMRPSRCDFHYAIQDPNAFVPPQGETPPVATIQVGPQGKIVSVDPDYQVGFRVMVGAQTNGGCQDIRAIYTWLHTDDSSRIRPSPADGGIWASELIVSNVDPGGADTPRPQFFQIELFSTDATEALATSSLRLHYDAGDLEFASRKWQTCNLWTRTFVGLHVASVDQRQKMHYEGVLFPGDTSGQFQARTILGDVKRNGNSWGIGPRFGGEGVYHLCGGFGFNARFATALLVGNRDSAYRQSFVATQVAGEQDVFEDQQWNVHTGKEVAVFPMFNARLGFSYLICCGCCGAISLEAGYEWITYIDMVPIGPHFRLDKGLNDLTCSTYSLDGVYLSLLAWF